MADHTESNGKSLQVIIMVSAGSDHSFIHIFLVCSVTCLLGFLWWKDGKLHGSFVK